MLLLIDDRSEAEEIAMELRRRGQCVVVWPYREGELRATDPHPVRG